MPVWANANAEAGSHPVDLSTPWRVSITLKRDPAVQAAFEKLLADQQDPASPMYHHWLTPTQIGELYGPTQHDEDALVNWLGSQGLKVVDVAPSRMLIDADGTIGSVAAAFETSFAYYKLGAAERRAARTEPAVPAALAPVIGSIGGMAEIQTEPQIHQQIVHLPKANGNGAQGGVPPALEPQVTTGATTHYLAAGDFDTIYDINSVVTGGNTGKMIGTTRNGYCPYATEQCIAIIGRSQITTADIGAYMTRFGANGETGYQLTQTVAPAGADPGITYDGNTQEATLDVERVVGTANGAQAVLVISASTNGTDGVDIATNYNVNTLAYPVMTISFGLCEAASSAAQQSSRQAIFSQAAAEGITTLVSSGDAGAAGCDTAFTTPPASQALNPNYLCATGYVTCVGGTEFNDASAYSTYWNTTNGSGQESAKSYIPEGAWNEPGTSPSYVVAGTGGGVSTYVTKPTFQTGTGVPADGFRDTPDVAFSAAGHDAYFGCYTSSMGSTMNCTNYYFSVSSGTSAAAPGMAGIVALLNTQRGFAGGNLNPLIYKLAATNPSVFHDVTVASSGVSGCTTATPSMCNNSTAGSASSLSGGQAGYAVTAGYDQATGWGSLDVANFLAAAVASELTVTSTHTGNFNSGSTGDVYTLTVTNNGGTATSGTISVVDTLPSGFTATALSGTGWTCTVSSVTCTQTAALAANTAASPITLTVSVSQSDSGSYTNTAAVSLGGMLSNTATDSTAVVGTPTIAEAFSPATIALNASSTVTFTLGNPAANPVSLTGVAFTDSLPAGLVVYSPSGASTTCSGGTVTAAAGGGSIAFSGATIAAGGTCTVTVNVTSHAFGSYVNTTGTVTASNSNAGSTATATLNVAVMPTKLMFTAVPPASITAGGNAGTVQVALEDGSGNVATNNSSTTVALSVTGPSGYSQTYTATTANGVAAFNLSSVPIDVAGTYSYLPSASGLTATAASEVVNPGAAAVLTVTGLTTFTAPQMSGTATVAAFDAYGNAATSFTGTVTLTSTDATAAFSPASYTYAGSDNGSHAFTVTFNTAGTQSVTATAGSLAGMEPNILVEDAILILNIDTTLARLTDAGVQTAGIGSAGTNGTGYVGALAFDNAGDVWTVSSAAGTVQEYSRAGTAIPVPGSSAAGVNSPTSLFIDGLGQVWVANDNNSISVLSNMGAAVSPSTGYQGGAMSGPVGIVVDNAGAVWVLNHAGNSVTKIFGAAAPVATPLVTGTTNNTLGLRP